MSDEKLNTGPEEPKAPDISGEAPAGPAPDKPTHQQEQAGPAQPAPGDVVISADQIDELMAQKRQEARDAVEKEGDPPGKAAGAPAKEQPPAGEKEPKQPRRGRTAKTEKPAPEAGKEPKTAGARKGRPPKADKAAPDKPQPPKYIVCHTRGITCFVKEMRNRGDCMGKVLIASFDREEEQDFEELVLFLKEKGYRDFISMASADSILKYDDMPVSCDSCSRYKFFSLRKSFSRSCMVMRDFIGIPFLSSGSHDRWIYYSISFRKRGIF